MARPPLPANEQEEVPLRPPWHFPLIQIIRHVPSLQKQLGNLSITQVQTCSSQAAKSVMEQYHVLHFQETNRRDTYEAPWHFPLMRVLRHVSSLLGNLLTTKIQICSFRTAKASRSSIMSCANAVQIDTMRNYYPAELAFFPLIWICWMVDSYPKDIKDSPQF